LITENRTLRFLIRFALQIVSFVGIIYLCSMMEFPLWLSAIILIAFFIVALLLRKLSIDRTLRNGVIAQGYTPLPSTGYFEESGPKRMFQTEKMDHAALLLHGFSSCPNEFRFLIERLKRENISYYAPLLRGFGMMNAAALNTASHSDWIASAQEAYTELIERADSVSIIAHSMGCMLALNLPLEKMNGHLILMSPYISPKTSHQLWKRLLLSPVLFALIDLIYPVVRKNNIREIERARQTGRFMYSAVPLRAIRELWRLTDTIPQHRNMPLHAHIFLGTKDKTINSGAVNELLSAENLNTMEHYFEGGEHNLVEEAESRDEVIDRIIEIIRASFISKNNLSHP
jgi:carboxylesterase